LTLLHFGGVHFRKSPEGVKDTSTVTSVSSLVVALLFLIRTRPSIGFRFMFAIFLLTCLSLNVNAQTSQTFNAAGTFTFTPPAGVTNITVECWGGGGAGGGATSNPSAGGGGAGGAYSKSSLTVTPGINYTVTVGTGGTGDNGNGNRGAASWFGTITTVFAQGGNGGLGADNNSMDGSGGAGSSAASIGGVTYRGGNGSGGNYNSNIPGGAGGAGAGSTGAGGDAAGGNGGTATNLFGGNGADGVDKSNNGVDGQVYGGGGSGGKSRNDHIHSGGDGATGQVIISWTLPAGYCAGNAVALLNIQTNGVINPENSINAPDNNLFATINDQNDRLALTLGDLLTSGGSIEVKWRRNASTSNVPRVTVEISKDLTSWTSGVSYSVNSLPWVTQTIPLSIDTKYIRFTEANAYDLDIDAISYFTPCGPVCIPPSTFTVTGGGNYCTGGAGLPVALSGSETGVEYQLFLGIVPKSTSFAGTGAAIDFGNQTTAGTYTVVATRLADACPAQMNGDATITIGTVPSTPSPIMGFISPCIGTAQTYSVTNVSGITYNWTFPADWIQSSGGTTNIITVIPGASSGNIEVTPSNSCGAGTSQILAVTPNATIALQPGAITGVAQQCQNTTGQVYAIAAVAGATSYSWTVPVGWTISSGQGTTSIIASTGLAGQKGSITVTAIYSCGSSAASTLAVVVTPTKPAIPGTITGPVLLCEGNNSLVYSIAPVTDATNYTWTVPAGWTITNGQGTTSITVNPGLAGQNGTVSVTAGNLCGTSAAKTLAVIVEAPPATPGAIAGNLTQCASRTGQNYSISAVANATSYTWTVPTGWTVTSGAGTTAIKANTGSSGQNGTVSVTASNTCGTSAARILNVSVLTASISANYCYGEGYIQLTANGGSAGDTYLWSTTQTSKQILVNTAGQYSVTIKNAAGCFATANYSVATELVVDGSFTNFNAASPSFYTDYDQNQGFISDVNTGLGPEGRYAVNTSAWSNYPDIPGGYHAQFHGRDHTNNSIGARNFMLVNGSDIKIGTPPRLRIIWQQTVTIIPNTDYYFSAWGMNLNPGSPAQLQFEIVTIQNGTQQVGSIADLDIAPKPANENEVALSNWVSFYSNPTWKSPIGATTATIRIINNNTIASGNDFGLDDISFATLAPLPAIIAPSSNASTFCAGQALNLFANLTGGKTPFTYSWTGPDGFTSNIANPTIPSVTVANTGVYNLTITDGYGCPSVTASTSPVTVNPSPLCSITGPATLCPSSTGNTYTAPAGAAIYAWSITGNGTIQGLTTGESVTVTAGAVNNSSFTLSLALTGSNGCTSNCQQVISVEDNVPPTFVLPVLTSQCVEYVSQALYNPGQENTPLDITYIRPDYYLVTTGSTMLNLSSEADNCALAVNPISWTIDFGNNGSIEFSGAGQLSTYGLDIQFPLGTNRISYTVTDLVGNVRVQFTDLIVTPRPVISNNF